MLLTGSLLYVGQVFEPEGAAAGLQAHADCRGVDRERQVTLRGSREQRPAVQWRTVAGVGADSVWVTDKHTEYRPLSESVNYTQ